MLTARDGQAEILLTPGVFLRVAQDSSFRMISNKLAGTRIEVLSGSAIAEVGELLEGNSITLIFRGADISLRKRGLYGIDSNPARFRVYNGEARLSAASQEDITAKKGREISFAGLFESKAFDIKQTDAVYNWSARRDQYIAQANVYAAKSALDSGAGNGNGLGSGSGTWAYNPWFGMFTYVPGGGVFSSPYGFGYYSAGTVGDLYALGSQYYGSGFSGVGGRPGVGRGVIQHGTSRTPLALAAGEGNGPPLGGGIGSHGASSIGVSGGGHPGGAGGRH
jgi:hypothetical protein